ncbi:hypothetical protein CH063_13792, partial [Colletotrichum higginsianum]
DDTVSSGVSSNGSSTPDYGLSSGKNLGRDDAKYAAAGFEPKVLESLGNDKVGVTEHNKIRHEVENECC